MSVRAQDREYVQDWSELIAMAKLETKVTLEKFNAQLNAVVQPKTKAVLEKINDQLTCCLCKKFLDEPKTLPCLHSFCFRCLRDKESTETNDGILNCPAEKCGEPASLIPGLGVAGIRTNHSLKNLVEFYKCERRVAGEEGETTCERCVSDDVATSFCSDCNNLLCRRCTHDHGSTKSTINHHLGSLEKIRSQVSASRGDEFEAPAPQRKTWKCPLHYEEGRDNPHDRLLDMCLYCVDCKEEICCMCAMAGKHAKHDREMCVDVVEAHKEAIREEIERTTIAREAVYQTFAKLKQREWDIEVNMEDTEKKIGEQYERIVLQLEHRKDDLLQRVGTIYEKQEKCLLHEIELLEKQRKKIDHVVKFVQRCLNHGTPEDKVYFKDEMVAQMRSVCRVTKLPPQKILQQGDIFFTEGRKSAVPMGSVSAEPCIEVSTADDIGEVRFVKGLETDFTITIRDVTHHVMEVADHMMLVELYPEVGPVQSKDIIRGKAKQQIDKKCHVMVTPRTEGRHYLSIQVEERNGFKHIENSPMLVDVLAQPMYWLWPVV